MTIIEQAINRMRQYLLFASILPFLFILLWKPDIAIALAEDTMQAVGKTTVTIGDVLNGLQDMKDVDWSGFAEFLESVPSVKDMSVPEWPELNGEPVVWSDGLSPQKLLDRILEITEWKLLKRLDCWYYDEFLDAIAFKYPGIEKFLSGEDVFSILIQNHKRDKDITEFLLLAHQMRTEEYGLGAKIKLAWTCGLKGLYAKFCYTRGEYSYYIVYTPVLLLLLIWLYRKVPIYKKDDPESEPAQPALMGHQELCLPPPAAKNEPVPKEILHPPICLMVMRIKLKNMQLALPPHTEEENDEASEEHSISAGRNITPDCRHHCDPGRSDIG